MLYLQYISCDQQQGWSYWAVQLADVDQISCLGISCNCAASASLLWVLTYAIFFTTDDIMVIRCYDWTGVLAGNIQYILYMSKYTFGMGLYRSFHHARRFNKYFDWMTEDEFKRSPQTGQSKWPSRLRVRSLQGLLMKVLLVILAKVLRSKVRRREAISWRSSNRRETKDSRGMKVLAEPICFGGSQAQGWYDFILDF